MYIYSKFYCNNIVDNFLIFICFYINSGNLYWKIFDWSIPYTTRGTGYYASVHFILYSSNWCNFAKGPYLVEIRYILIIGKSCSYLDIAPKEKSHVSSNRYLILYSGYMNMNPISSDLVIFSALQQLP